jgi:transcriptional regulator with XRE-family HTH domain
MGESTLALLESGRLRPSATQLAQLRRFFGQEADSLFDEVRERVASIV